jgi:hypothetical protein
MKLKALTQYQSKKTGKRRTIKLYRAWDNMNARLAGTSKSHGKSYWEGVGGDFYTWQEFRVWALTNGYSKQNNSLDRIDPSKGYTRNNCRWIPWNFHRKLTYWKRGIVKSDAEA